MNEELISEEQMDGAARAESDVVIWIHGDCLAPDSPALVRHASAPAIWVWDDELLEEWRLSLKRIVFIYECLLELPLTIRRGSVADEVSRFAREHNAARVVTINSPSPRFGSIVDEISRAVGVEVLEAEPFLDYDGHLDLKRFSRYWRVAQRYAFGDKQRSFFE